MKMFQHVKPTQTERSERRPGDDLVPLANVVMDRAFTVPGAPADVWPWIVQLGKRRAGWYLSTRLERFIPARRRGLRLLDPRWQSLHPGDDIPDYGGRDETFTVAAIELPSALVYRSQRRSATVSWSITLRLRDTSQAETRVLLRLRMGPVKRVWLAKSAGELIDLLTVAGLATGLRERVGPS